LLAIVVLPTPPFWLSTAMTAVMGFQSTLIEKWVSTLITRLNPDCTTLVDVFLKKK
jgi:hypothetical protein